MSLTRMKWVKMSAIGATAICFFYFCVIVLTPTFGTIVGYADQPPPLRISQLADDAPRERVEKVLRLAKYHFDKRPDFRQTFWPEPSAIGERADCWLVTFTAKTPIYRFCGIQQTFHPTAPAMHFSIDKATFGTRLGNWCQ